MGRWSWSSRMTVEQCKSLDISWLSREVILIGYYYGSIDWKDYL